MNKSNCKSLIDKFAHIISSQKVHSLWHYMWQNKCWTTQSLEMPKWPIHRCFPEF